MKKIVCLLFGIMLLVVLCSCGCEHSWEAATCTTPKTCSACAETEGEPLGHSWKDATCTAPKTCSACSETEGESLGHTWTDATCTTPKTCSVCSETEGTASHSWKDATCSTPKKCSVCGEESGSPVAHQYSRKNVSAEYLCTEATPLSPATYYYVCTYCGEAGSNTYTYGSSLPSAWEADYYVDNKFGEPTDEWYVRSQGTGTFSNTATTNSLLAYKVLYDCKGDITIFLYEYGSSLVQNSSSRYSDYYEITIKNEKGKVLEVRGKIYPGGDRICIIDDHISKTLSMMKSSTTMKFYIEEEDRPTTQYRFDLDLTGFTFTMNYAKEHAK